MTRTVPPTIESSPPAGERRASSTSATPTPRALELAVVILNYRTPRLVIDCLRYLADQIDPTTRCAAVVDNASGDDSADQIAKAIDAEGWSAWARVIRSDRNDGFSAGNNVGLDAVDAEAYLLLNSDTLVRPGAIDELLAAMRKNPDAGIVSPRLEWPSGEPQISCFRDFTPLTELLLAAQTGPLTKLLRRHDVPTKVYDAPVEVAWTSFAAVMIRREAVRRVGLMDEGYFMYFEDADYCRRLRRAGWKVLHWPAARIVHLRGGTSPVKAAAKAREPRPRYYYASRSRYYARFYGRVGLWAANLLWLAGRAVSFTREVLGHRGRHTCKREERDIWTNAWRPLRTPARAADHQP